MLNTLTRSRVLEKNRSHESSASRGGTGSAGRAGGGRGSRAAPAALFARRRCAAALSDSHARYSAPVTWKCYGEKFRYASVVWIIDRGYLGEPAPLEVGCMYYLGDRSAVAIQRINKTGATGNVNVLCDKLSADEAGRPASVRRVRRSDACRPRQISARLYVPHVCCRLQTVGSTCNRCIAGTSFKLKNIFIFFK